MSKILKITAALMIISCFLSLCACSCSDPVDTTPSNPATTSAQVTETETPATETQAELGINLYAVYSPKTAYDESGNEIDLNVAFGTGYSNYGGTLEFHEDGTFLVYIGINKGDGVGTYKLTSLEEVSLEYNNGKTDTVKITKAEENIATELLMHYGAYDVVFV